MIGRVFGISSIIQVSLLNQQEILAYRVVRTEVTVVNELHPKVALDKAVIRSCSSETPLT